MSKELEALKEIFDGRTMTHKEYIFFEQLVKRNEPMKPKVAWKNEEDKEIVAYRCLNCNGSLGAKLDNKPMFPNFCRHCGQKLDWSSEKYD